MNCRLSLQIHVLEWRQLSRAEPQSLLDSTQSDTTEKYIGPRFFSSYFAIILTVIGSCYLAAIFAVMSSFCAVTGS